MEADIQARLRVSSYQSVGWKKTLWRWVCPHCNGSRGGYHTRQGCVGAGNSHMRKCVGRLAQPKVVGQ